MARTPRRRSTPARSRRRRGPRLPSFRLPAISPDVGRSLVGISLLVLGAMTLIALVLQGQGALTDWWRDSIAPWFGTLRWLLPFLLLAVGWYTEWGPGRQPNSGWGAMLVGVALAFAAVLGLVEVLGIANGGRLGRFLDDALRPLVTAPGAAILLLGIVTVGLAWGLNVPIRQLLWPVTGTARWMGETAAASLRREPGEPEPRIEAATDATSRPGGPAAGSRRRRNGPPIPNVEVPGQAGIWGGNPNDAIPAAIPNPAPVSATLAPARSAASAVATPVHEVARPARDPDDVTDASDSPPTRERIAYTLPPQTLLDEGNPNMTSTGDAAVHHHNEEIIIRKLAGFNIRAQIVGRNAGPVVTQYEVQPAPDVKVSRIEALSDDLAMALAARSLRIEAPIPGKSAVGIEIPNKDFNIVALRRILDEVDFAAMGSRLTFALGRDVAGKAQAVDLARMPHLLIAGATGSGKSVMVNALIASLLMNATPDDLRLILVDLKRVELASYNGLPHLLVPVITEPDRARNALAWAVNEMESRYRRFAGASARNVRAYNESRADPADRMPFIVVVIDELADLMMREGKTVEDPIVRLAQKARATGIHLVLATQRPSVNVVTGLIKANFPSRIAFAMASQIDSRTILDTPGAEDLIGRGDMLYQPSDLPRPMRLQGVFVSDAEIHRLVEHWQAQIEDPHYDMAIIAGGDNAGGSTAEVDDLDVDRLLMDAVDVVREYDRASASLLQRRLKIGYARAARIIDQLEARGYVGPFDGSNARQVLRRETAPPPGPPDPADD